MLPIKSAIAVLVLLAMAACSTLDQIESSPMTSQLITNQITLRFIAGSDDPVERAARVREVVELVRSQVSGDETYTLSALDEAVRSEINWQSLSIADQEILNFGLTRARAAIADLVGEGVIEPDDRGTVATLLTWIDQAAQRVR